jgi:hypothetical protein
MVSSQSSCRGGGIRAMTRFAVVATMVVAAILLVHGVAVDASALLLEGHRVLHYERGIDQFGPTETSFSFPINVPDHMPQVRCRVQWLSGGFSSAASLPLLSRPLAPDPCFFLLRSPHSTASPKLLVLARMAILSFLSSSRMTPCVPKFCWCAWTIYARAPWTTCWPM